MARLLAAASFLAFLAACDGEQPLGFAPDPDAPPPPEELDVPPGTEEPTAVSDILRFEERNEDGGGRVTSVAYDAAAGTFTVDNLGFDGPNVYSADSVFPVLNTYVVYEADLSTPDFLTGDPIAQITPYKAVTGQSTVLVDGEPRTSFAVVRTGGYANYGFGGFVFERQGGVGLPTTGQAQFTGDYAGVRIFQSIGGLEYTTGDVVVAIDFEDFNANDAVMGTISNRVAYTEGGALIGLDDDLIIDDDDRRLVLPDINWLIVEGALSINEDGEMQSDISSTALLESGLGVILESGTFNGILAGDLTAGDGGELVGVIVVESEDPRVDGLIVQETGGFILER